jgi:hypothetical protein
MNREKRVVSLAILTFVAYAAIQFVYSGVFLFPFPLNEGLALVVSAQFFWWNYKKDTAQYSIILLTTTIHLLSTQLFWTFFIDTPGMEWFVSTSWLDILRILYYLLLIAWMYLFLRAISDETRYFIFFLGVVFVVLSAIFSYSLCEFLAFSTIFIAASWQKIETPIRYLWLLLAVLQLMSLSTLFI